MVLAIVFGIIILVAHYFSEIIDIRYTKDRMKNISFSAGIFITFLFLELFPMLFQQSFSLTQASLIFMLLGFTLFHVIQKYEYQHISRKRMRGEIKELHSIAFFIYHFVIGMILVAVTQLSAVKGLLFLIAVFTFTVISSISLKEIHPAIKERARNKIVLSSSTFLGVILASIFPIAGMLYAALIGIVAGTLFFIVMEESIPREREGEPLFFLYGIVVYALVIAITWTF
jgi:hypothetical protein